MQAVSVPVCYCNKTPQTSSDFPIDTSVVWEEVGVGPEGSFFVQKLRDSGDHFRMQ